MQRLRQRATLGCQRAGMADGLSTAGGLGIAVRRAEFTAATVRSVIKGLCSTGLHAHYRGAAAHSRRDAALHLPVFTEKEIST